MPIFWREGTCVGEIFTWKWGQILASKRGKFMRQRNKMAANLDLFRMHLHRQPNANTKLDLRSPIVDRENWGKLKYKIWLSKAKVL